MKRAIALTLMCLAFFRAGLLRADNANPPLVLELFTSQGCSSCPQAENLLDFLNERYRGAVLPLSFHVDYWDDNGWKDVFSSPEFTQRQREYRDALHDKDLYTPELVVHGEIGFIGSDRKRAEMEIRKRLEIPRLPFQIARGSTPAEGAFSLQISIPHETALQVEKVDVILFENAASVHVQSGENARKLLSGDFAVRHLMTQLPAASGTMFLQVPLNNVAKLSKAGVAVLLRGSAHRVVTSQSLYPLEDLHAPRM